MARTPRPATEQPAVDETHDPLADEQPSADAPDAGEQGGDEAELAPLTDDEYVARVRAGYGRECAACERKMLGGQGLTLNEYREPIHRSCA